MHHNGRSIILLPVLKTQDPCAELPVRSVLFDRLALWRLFYGSSIQCDLKTKASTTETVSFGNEEQTAESCWYHVKENILEDGTVQWPSGWIFGTIAGISQ